MRATRAAVSHNVKGWTKHTEKERYNSGNDSASNNYGTFMSSYVKIEGDEKENEAEETDSRWGYFYAVMCGLSFTSCNGIIKYISTTCENCSTWQLLFLRSLFQVLALLMVIYRKKYTLFGFDDWRTKVKVICQAVIGGGILFSVFEAIGRLPIGDFSAIAFSSPVFTMILSSFILQEKCGLYRVSVGALLIVGVVVLTRPSMTFDTSSSQMTPFPKNITTIDPGNEIETRVVPTLDTNLHKSDIIGIFFAVLTAVLSAAISILARKTQNVHSTVLVCWFGLGGLAVSVLGLALLDTARPLFSTWSPVSWALASAQAVIGLLGVYFLYRAIALTSPTRVMVIRSFEIVFSYILQVTLFGKEPHSLDYLGALMIVIAVFSMGFENYLKQRLRCCS